MRVENTIVQEFDIESNVEISSFGVSFSGTVPSGIVVTDSATGSTGADGNVFGSATSRIKVTMPFSDGDDDLKFDMELKLVMENKAVLYGVSHNSALQNYYVSPIPLILDYIPVSIAYEEGDTPPPPTEIALNIFKYEDGTRIPLEGAIFKVTNATEGVIGTYATDENGSIVIEDLPEGAYYAEEIIPPTGYVLSENYHQDVVLRGETDVVVTFENKKEAQLEIMKIDSKTDQPLADAVIRVALNDGSDFIDVRTDSSGKAYLSNLEEGTPSILNLPVFYLE